MSARVLAVEDDAGIASVLQRGLQLAGHEVTIVPTIAGAREVWRSGAFGLVLLDVMLPDGDGLDLLAERRAAGDRTPVVLVTAREEAELERHAAAAGASGRLAKPFAFADLVACVERFASVPQPPDSVDDHHTSGSP